METVKASVRLFVLAFVIVGAMISLAGPDSRLLEEDTATAEQQDHKKHAKSSKELIKAELGSTG